MASSSAQHSKRFSLMHVSRQRNLSVTTRSLPSQISGLWLP
jgi:hypothetical protein